MEVDRQVRLLAERRDELPGGRRLEQTGHVLDADDVGAGLLQLVRQTDVIFEVVFGAVGIEDVAGVADGAFAELARLAHRLHGDAHVLHPVEAIEDAEEIDAGMGGLAHEEPDDVVGVIGVADRVGAAQQHLQQDVRRLLADVDQPLPRVLGKEAHGDVEGGAAPAFQRQKLRQGRRIGRCDGDQIVRAHARGEQRLVGVAHGGVGHQRAGLAAHPAGEGLRPVTVEALLAAGRWRGSEGRRRHHQRFLLRARAVAGVGMAVHGDVGDVGEELGGAVLTPDRLEQLRRLVDETRGVAGVAEGRVADDVFEEGEIGGDAANAEFAQRPIHARDRLGRGRRPGGDLFQERVVEAGDDRARISGAAIEADAEAGGAAIGGDAAVVRDEVLLGILGGDAALQGVAVEADLALARHPAGLLVADGGALGDPDLRLDDVDAGHLLGDGMLDLDARIDLDEVDGAAIGIHEEFDGAGADIVRGMGDGDGVAAQLLPLLLAQIRRRRALDHLLVAALDCAVALEEMDDGAVPVGEDLHLDMTGALDQLFQIDLVLAEGGLGLAARSGEIALQRRHIGDDAHAAAAAAP